MKKKSFVPRTDSECQTWLKNFAAKLPNYSSRYGISTNEVNEVAANSQSLKDWFDFKTSIESYASKVVAYKNELLHGLPAGISASQVLPPFSFTPPPANNVANILGRAVSIANRIKEHSDYRESDGKDLMLEGAEIAMDDNHAKPDLKVRLIDGGHPEIIWKKGQMDGIEIYLHNDTTGAWALIAVSQFPNFVDNSPLPAAGKGEYRQYRAIYRRKDAQVGEWSDIVSIMVTGL